MPTRDRQQLRRALVQFAATQAGYFTAEQALMAGYSYQAQRHHVQRGNWSRVDRGLFRLPEWPAGRFEHLVRWSLLSKGRGVVSHESALAVHDLGDANPGRVHMIVPRGFRARLAGVVAHRAALDDADVEDHPGFRVTTPRRTLVDVAAGTLDQDGLDLAVVQALDRGLITRRGLVAAAEAHSARAALRIERAIHRPAV
jgi:predicted transcriptional regulator of viral defense system